MFLSGWEKHPGRSSGLAPSAVTLHRVRHSEHFAHKSLSSVINIAAVTIPFSYLCSVPSKLFLF